MDEVGSDLVGAQSLFEERKARVGKGCVPWGKAIASTKWAWKR